MASFQLAQPHGERESTINQVIFSYDTIEKCNSKVDMYSSYVEEILLVGRSGKFRC